MKKLLCVLFVSVIMIFTLVSCGNKCKHENLVPEPAKAATCTESGLTEGQKCADCGEMITAQETVPAKGHTAKAIKATEASCTAEGQNAGEECSVCKTVLSGGETIPKLDHKETPKKNVEPTCTKDGSKGGTFCSECFNDITPAEVVPALGHDEVDLIGKAATCTEEGLTDGKQCKRCETVTVAQKTIDALGHDEEDIPAVEATCVAEGSKDGKICSVCNTVTVNPTVVPIDENAHSEDAIIDVLGKAPTCTETGLGDGKQCTLCKAFTVAQETIDALGHDEYEYAPKLDPTCETTGLTAHIKCKNCDYEVLPEEVATLEHSFGEWETILPPTETTAGEQQTICPNCGSNVTKDIPALGDDSDLEIDEDGIVPAN